MGLMDLPFAQSADEADASRRNGRNKLSRFTTEARKFEHHYAPTPNPNQEERQHNGFWSSVLESTVACTGENLSWPLSGLDTLFLSALDPSGSI